MDLQKALGEMELKEALQSLPSWSGDENGIKRELVFEDFPGAMKFMQACVDGIEARNHHPIWTNKYNSVTIRLDTFDIGHKVTRKDIELARFIDSVLTERAQEFGYVDD